MITIKTGKILESDAKIICFQANCQGVMDYGIGKKIKEAYPNVYTHYESEYDDGDLRLGHIVETDTENEKGQTIVALCAQDDYGSEVRHTNYVAFQKCLDNLMMLAYTYEDKPVIAMPYKIGCDKDGGGSWKIINEMISENLKDFEVELWKYDG